MPSQAVERDLRDAGYTVKQNVPCPKCGTLVDLWESPAGRPFAWNTAAHPTEPGILHLFSCGQQDEPEDNIPGEVFR